MWAGEWLLAPRVMRSVFTNLDVPHEIAAGAAPLVIFSLYS
jgi:hypothetical protein